jgi:DNA-binding response OmpR family regulator
MTVKKVLIAEDQPDSRRLLEDVMGYFKPHGVNTLIARDGEEALEVALKEKPDLILLDIMMPRLTGLEVLEKIKQDPALASTYVIMVSAKFQQEDRMEAARLGADEYLTKPYDIMIMLERIGHALKITLNM